MRAKEFITEATRLPLSSDVARALPGTYALSGLPNSDFYLQYRFGVAIAGIRGQQARQNDEVAPYQMKGETVWGENQIVSSYMDPHIGENIELALRELNLPTQKKLISTPTSEEATDIDKVSPVKGFKGYKK